MSKTDSTTAAAAEDDDDAVRAAYADDARERIAAQADRAQRARASARREHRKLDQVLAESISADPIAVLWYARPGVLGLVDAARAATLTELKTHQAVERHRAAAAKPRR